MAQTTVVTEELTDLEMLFDFAKDAETAAMGYTAAAAMCHDVKVRGLFERMAAASLETQDRTVQLLRRLGGKA